VNDEKQEIAEIICRCAGGDKLGGWPGWIQWPEYPNCRVCEQRMDYVFQIDSQDNLPWMWGDSGCGHIFQCSVHKDVVAFCWACC
jgi:uncharacterized protein YwqG